jgi:cytoplasmic iron level regulating protein YaaA (DUF328/UPF0246 family)
MITLLSPAKTLNFDTTDLELSTMPRQLYDTNRLAAILKKKSARSLGKLMSITEKLAHLNAERYTNYSEEFTPENSKQSILAFSGDVYRGLAAEELKLADLEFAQDHLRILSGFYGLVRPLDRIQAYRLEMGTKLRTSRGQNLYKFWGNRITDLLENDIKETGTAAIINLASNEYFKVIDSKRISVPIYDIQFKEYRNDKLTFVSFNAKKARGMMARYIIDNRLDKPTDLKAFNIEDYEFSLEHSDEFNYLFIR